MDEISTASQKENSLILTENKADATYFVIYQRSSNNPQSFHVRTLEKTTYYYGGNGNSSYIYWNTYNGDNGSVVGFWNAADERVRFWTYNTIEYDPNRSANIALIFYADGEKRYIIAPKGLKVGNKVVSGVEADIKVGNACEMRNIPEGTFVHNVEITPGKGG